MKITRLDLIAFGHFTDCSLDLAGGSEGLQIVYGPNEAGKSTALRAITTLLYGFPHQTPDSFKHQNRDLRVGGQIVDDAGRAIDCVRRKARHESLHCGDDARPIDEAFIATMLRGVDRDAFLDRFGITHQALVEGGRLMIRGDGDLGQSLFAAGAGLGRLLAVQDGLDQECAKLFKKNGKKTLLNHLLADLHERRRELKECILPVNAFTALTDEITHKQLEVETLRNAVLQLRLKQDRLQGLKNASPILRDLTEVDDSLQSLVDVPTLGLDFAGRYHQANVDSEAVRQKREMLHQRIASAKRQLHELNQPSDLLHYAESIESLAQALGGMTKAARERPGLVKRRDVIRSQIESRLKSVGRQSDESIGAMAPALRAKISVLASKHASLVQRVENAAESLQILAAECNELESQIEEMDKPKTCDDLARLLQRVGDASEIIHDLETCQAVVAREDRAIESQRSRLGAMDGDIETIVHLHAPSEETIQQYVDLFDQNGYQREQAERELRQQKEAMERLAGRAAELNTKCDVPTEQDLSEARRKRDALGQQIRSQITSDQTRSAVKTDQVMVDQWMEFAEAIKACDVFVDRLRHEADRVASRASLEAERVAGQQAVERLEQEIGVLHDRQRDHDLRWCDVWKDLPIDPMTPREMLAWRCEHERLRELYEKRVEALQVMHRQEDRIARCRSEVTSAMKKLGARPKSNDLVGLIDEATQRLQDASKQARDYDEHRNRHGHVRKSIKQTELQKNSAQAALENWTEQWSEVTAKLDLQTEVSPDEVASIVASYQDILAWQVEHDGYQRRIEGIDADAASFQQQIKAIGLPVPDPDPGPVRVVETWAKQLSEARMAATRAEQIDQQVRADEGELTRLEEQRVDCNARLEQMLQEAGVQEVAALGDVMQASVRKKELVERRQHLIEQIAGFRGTMPLQEFCDQIRSTNMPSIELELDEVQSQLHDVQQDYEQANQDLGELNQQRKQMDGGSRGAELQQSIQELLAQIDHHAREYARRRVATTLLRQAIVRYRERHRGPILGIASEFFRRLTLGSYCELRTDNNDRGEPVLLAVRASDGATVELHGMSHGTADQLFLALRLASLKHDFQHRSPIPVIVDDILIQCDQQRSHAALELFAELSEITQVIFFTHNQSLVDIARKCVPKGKLFVRQLEAIQSETVRQPDAAAEEPSSMERMLF